MKLWHFPTLAGIFAMVGACSGVTDIGGDDPGVGGEGGETSGGGGTSGSGGKGGMGGTSGSVGTGGGNSNPCAGKPCGAACSDCPPDAMACDAALRYCDASGQCGAAFPVCENECETSMDCAVVDLPCQICPDGSYSCPGAECQAGRCISTYPTCGSQCMTDMDCPAILAPCQPCPGGMMASCPTSECVMGRCTTGWPGCGGEDPCAGRACGDPCSTCTGMECPVSDIALVCNAEGKCAAEPPRCGGACMTTLDCPMTDLCYMCPGNTCGNLECVNASCTWTCPPVDPPEPECTSAMDCPILMECRRCPDMTCAITECLNGDCVTVCGL
jgi:hypothetical protein